MTRKTDEGLQLLSKLIRARYGSRLKGLYRIDISGQYDYEDEPDEEVVVVLADGVWNPSDESEKLSDMTYDVLLETDLFVLAEPIQDSAWADPSKAADPISVKTLKTRAKLLTEAVQA